MSNPPEGLFFPSEGEGSSNSTREWKGKGLFFPDETKISRPENLRYDLPILKGVEDSSPPPTSDFIKIQNSISSMAKPKESPPTSSKPFKLDPINPFEDPGKWFHESWKKLEDPVKEAWHSEHWAVPKTALAFLGSAMSVIPAGLTTAMGFRDTPSLWEASEQYAKGHDWVAPARWALEGAGFAGDIFLGGKTDPLRLITFGPRTLTRVAEKIINEKAGVTGVVDLAKQRKLDKFVRMGTELTPENVREVAVPEIIRRTMAGASWAAKEDIKELPHISKTWGDYEINNHVFGANAGTPITSSNPLRAPKSYLEMRNGFLQNETIQSLKPYHRLPMEMLQDPNVEFYEKIRAIAGHAAYSEKEILDGMAKTRVHVPYGKPQDWLENAKRGIAIGPSPIRALGKVSKLFYKWEDKPQFRQPMKEYVPQDTLNKVTSWAQARGIVNPGFHAGELTPIELEQFLRMVQVGMEAHSSGVITEEKALFEWVKDELQGVPTQYQLSHLKNIEATMETALLTMERHPENVFSTSLADMRKGVKNIKNIVAAAEGQPGASAKNVLYDVQGLKQHEFNLNRRMARVKELSKEINTASSQSGAEIAAAIQKGGPEGAVDALVAGIKAKGGAVVKEASNGVAATYETKLVQKFTEMLEQYAALRDLTTPYSVAVQNRMFRKNYLKTLDEIYEATIANKEILRRHFNSKNMQNMDGLLILNNLLNSEHSREFIKNLVEDPVAGKAYNFSTQKGIEKWLETRPQKVANSGPNKGAILSPARTAQNIAQERQGIQKIFEDHIDKHVKSYNLPIANAVKMKNFISSLSDEKFAGLLYGMRDLASASVHGSFEAALQERLIAPLEESVREMEGMLRSEYAVEYTNLTNELAKFQTVYKPNQYLTYFFGPNGFIDKLNDLGSKIFRRKGLNYFAIEAMRAMESTRAEINPTAEDYAKDLSKKYFINEALIIDPSIVKKIGGTLETDLSEGAGAYCQYVSTLSNPTRSLKELAIAKEKVKEGLDRLTKVFGSPQKAEEFAKKVFENVSNHSEEEFHLEANLGLSGVFRKNYFPYVLVGDKADREEFRKILMVSGAPNVPAYERAVISRNFGAAEHRVFRDAAGVQAYIDEINERRVADGGKPLNVKVDNDLVAALGDRKRRQLTTMSNRDMIAKLQVYLPGNSFIRKFSNAGRKVIEQGTEWTSLGDLVPSMADHYISKDLHAYLSQYIPVHQAENQLYSMLSKYWSFSTRVQVQFSLQHLKNLAALAFIAGVDPLRFGRIISEALVEQKKLISEFPGAGNFMLRISKALERSPLYRNASRNGISHFRGVEQYSTVSENIKRARKPQWSPGRIAEKGLASTLIFDVMDRAAKMSLYEQLLEQGVPNRTAADWVNYYMIDYSARNLTPQAKSWGYALAPFFAWKVQNHLLHIPNMIQYPARYAMVNYFRHYFPDHVWHSNPYVNEKMPDALADSMALPLYDKQGNQLYLSSAMPWDQFVTLFNNTAGANPTNPLAWSGALFRHFMARSRLSNEFKSAYSFERLKRAKTETLYETLFGTEKEPGMVDTTLWGVLPLAKSGGKVVESMINPAYWKDFGGNFLDFSTRMAVGELKPVSPWGTYVQYPKGM
jgi:hypothetical protein